MKSCKANAIEFIIISEDTPAPPSYTMHRYRWRHLLPGGETGTTQIAVRGGRAEFALILLEWNTQGLDKWKYEEA